MKKQGVFFGVILCAVALTTTLLVISLNNPPNDVTKKVLFGLVSTQNKGGSLGKFTEVTRSTVRVAGPAVLYSQQPVRFRVIALDKSDTGVREGMSYGDGKGSMGVHLVRGRYRVEFYSLSPASTTTPIQIQQIEVS